MSDGDTAALIGLLSLPEMGPVRLRRLVAGHDGSAAAFEAVRRGTVATDIDLHRRGDNRAAMLAMWRAAASGFDTVDALARHRSHGLEILDPSHPDWPEAFVDDPEPPVLLFARGDRALLARVGVAVIGTRRCTAGGIAMAKDLGRDLADVDISVISGLALGIDGAAHRGALDGGGPTVGVVATGLDVVYPRRHRTLWEEVATAGVLVSESPLGTPATRWRFPARNRLMAALAAVVVVVESGLTGGSMRTVESALERDTDIGAVPGPVRAPQSMGPNQLLADGVSVVRGIDDVLTILGTRAPLASRHRGSEEHVPFSAVGDGTDRGSATEVCDDPVGALVSSPPVSLDRLVAETGLSFGEVANRLMLLELDGVVERVADGYQRRVR